MYFTSLHCHCIVFIFPLLLDFTLGILAGDEETYTTFSDLLDPCISDYHNGFSKDRKLY